MFLKWPTLFFDKMAKEFVFVRRICEQKFALVLRKKFLHKILQTRKNKMRSEKIHKMKIVM